MGINVGEVEAVLAARDTMSPKLVDAAEKVAALRIKLGELTGQINAFSDAQSRNTPEWARLSGEFAKVSRELGIAETQFKAVGEAQERAAIKAAELAAKEDLLAEKMAEAATATQANTGASNANTAAQQASSAAAGTSAARLAELEKLTKAATTAAQVNTAAAERQTAVIMQAATAHTGGAAAASGFGASIAASDTAVKAATDNVFKMGSALVAAQASTKTTGAEITRLKEEFNGAVTNLQAMTNASTAAATRQSALATAAASGAVAIKGAAAATKEIGDEAEIAARKMGPLEGLTARLVAYMAIMYASRQMAGFIADMFLAAEALVNLNERTDLSINKLQELKYAADVTGVTFEKSTAALDAFDKNLAGMKITTADALADIGLSFSRVFSMTAEERIEAVFSAIARLPTQLQRTQAEIKIFGTDAIDPMIKQWEGLKQAAHDNSVVMGDEQVKALAGTLTMYRQFGAEVGGILSGLIVKAQELVAVSAAPLFGGPKPAALKDLGYLITNPFGYTIDAVRDLYNYTTTGDGRLPGAGSFARNPPPPTPNPYDIYGPSPDQGGPAKQIGGGTMGSARINELKEELATLRDLNSEQLRNLEWLREHGLLTADEAARQDLTTAQFRAYTDAMKDRDKVTKELSRSAQAFAEIMAKADADIANAKGKNKEEGTLQDKLDAIDMEVYHAQLAAQKRIGWTSYEWEAEYRIWEVGEAKKATLIDNEEKKIADKREKATNDSIARTTRLWDQYEADVTRIEEGAWAAKIAQVDVWYDKQKQTLDRSKDNNANYWNELEALDNAAEARRDKVRQQRADAEQRSLEKLTVEWDQYQQAREIQTGTSMDVQIAGVQRWFDQEVARIKDSDEHWMEHWEVLEATAQQRIANIIHSYDPLWQAWKAGNEDMRREWANTWERAFDLDSLIDNWKKGNESVHDAKVKLDQATAAYEKLRDKGTATAEELVAANQKVVEAQRNVEQSSRNMLHAITDPLVKAFEQPFLDIEKMFIKMLAGMVTNWEMQLLGPMLQSTRNWLGQIFGMATGGPTSTGMAGGGYASGYIPGFQHGVGPTWGGWGGTATSTDYYSPSYWDVNGGYGGGSALGSTSTIGYMALPGGAQSGTMPGGGWMAKHPTAGRTVLGIAGGVAMGAQADTSQGFNHAMITGLGMDSASGITSTVMMGIATAGISVGVQAAVAAIKYAMRDRTPEDIVRAARDDFGGQEWSPALVKQITDLAKTRNTGIGGNKDEQVAEVLSLPSIMAEHPVSLANLEMYEGKVHDIFSMIETGRMTLAEGTEELELVFPQLAAVATDSYGRIDTKLKELIALNDRFGTQSKEITKWKQEQAGGIVGGVNAVLEGQPLDDFDKIYADIEKALAADSDPKKQAQLKVLKGKVDDAQAAYDRLVKRGDATPDQLAAAQAKIDLAKMAVKDASPDLADALSRQTAARAANKDDVADLSLQAKGAYDIARSTGMSPLDAIKAESAGLTALQKEYKDLGIDVEDTGLKHLFVLNTVITKQPALLAGLDGLTKSVVGMENLGKETKEMFEAQERSGVSAWERIKAATIAAGGTEEDALELMQGWLHVAADEADKLGVSLDDTTQELINQSKAAGIWQDDIKPKPTIEDAIGDLRDTIDDLSRALRGLPPKVKVKVEVETTHTDDGKGGNTTGDPRAGGGVIDKEPGTPDPSPRIPITYRVLARGYTNTEAATGGQHPVIYNTYNVENNINAIDAKSFEDMIAEDGVPVVVAELENNRRGALTRITRAQQAAGV